MAKNIEIKDVEERKELGQQIVDDWDDDNLDRQQWLDDLPKWLDAYQGRPVKKDKPWKDASNLFVPVTATAIDAIHPRLMAALFKPTPICSFKAQEPSDVDLARKNEMFLDYAAREECNLFPLADRFILGTLINGIQVVKVTWEVKTRNVRDRHVYARDVDPLTAIQEVLSKEQAYADAIEKLSDEEYEVAIGKNKIVIEVEQKNDQFIVITEREEVVRDAPIIDIVKPEDIAFPSDTPYDLQKAERTTHRYWLTMDQIKGNVKTKSFRCSDDDLEKLELMASADIDADDDTILVKQARESITGGQETYKEAGPAKVELLEAYTRYDINDDGYDEEIIVTVPKKCPDILLRVNRLEDVYRHGMRPFVLFYLNPVSDSVWAQGIPQMVQGLQEEINVIHNQRVDGGTLNNQPFGWYQPGAGIKNERMPIVPGFLNPVQDVNQVKMHQPGNYHAWGFQEEAQLHTLFERRTKVSDITIGRAGESQGAARTATGVNALNQQQATGFDIYIRRIQEGWKQLLQQLLALYKQYMPAGKFVRITGTFSDPTYVISKEDLSDKMDMIFTGNSLSTDREVERNTTTFLAQSVMNPQILMFLMQLGIMQPPGVAEWFRHLMTVFDVPNYERILSVPEMPKIYKPNEIMNRLMSGEKLLPKQGEDHDAVIMLITQYMSDEAQRVVLDPAISQLLQQQVQMRQAQKVNEQIQMMMQMNMLRMGMGGGSPMMPGGQGGAPVPLPGTGNGMTF